MEYKIEDIERVFSGELAENLGGGEYILVINGKKRSLRILGMDSRRIEFVLDRQYHTAVYLEASTSMMRLILDGTATQVRMHANLDEIVYKNSGGSGGGDSDVSLRSQIPGKVVSLSVGQGDSVQKGDSIAVLESMKMQVTVKSHRDGTVRAIRIKEGGSVAKNDVIAEIE